MSVFDVSSLAEIGVFGGSGFYSLLETPYEHTPSRRRTARPATLLAIGEIGGRRVAFLARHGAGHQYPAHAINYRANVWAMASVGVTPASWAPAPPAACSRTCEPGDFVVCDQFVDRTSRRGDTFYDGPPAVHISAAEPYCPELRPLAVDGRPRAGHHGPRARHGGRDPGAALHHASREPLVRASRAGK